MNGSRLLSDTSPEEGLNVRSLSNYPPGCSRLETGVASEEKRLYSPVPEELPITTSSPRTSGPSRFAAIASVRAVQRDRWCTATVIDRHQVTCDGGLGSGNRVSPSLHAGTGTTM